MRTPILVRTAILGLVSLAACGGSPKGDGSHNTGGQQAVTVNQVHGSWSSEDGMVTAYQFNADQSFFRDGAVILNGMVPNGGSLPNFKRTTGWFEIDDSQLTLHDDDGTDEVFSITFKQAIINGIFLPGKEPKSKITLTRQVQVDGQFQPDIAFPTVTFDHQKSWCVTTDDCMGEFGDGSWSPNVPASCQGVEASCTSCSASSNACAMVDPNAGTGGGGSNCEVQEGGSCLNSNDDCANAGGVVSSTDCTGSSSGGTVCCDMPATH